MSQTADIAERREEILGIVAELDFVAVRAAHASYLAAIDTDDEAEKGRTYQRTRDLDEHVAEICAAMGLNPERAARWRDLPPADLALVKTWIDDLTGYVKPPWEGSG